MTDAIITALTGIHAKASSRFCHKIIVPCDSLSVEVHGLGKLHLPLSKKSARSLITQARPAKYGLKEQTLLDTSVRDTWEIPKSRIKIDKRLWKKEFDAALVEMKYSLGLADDATLEAQLHNLVIYESGQFFKAHQDSEKCDGMVATLVVLLPSAYRGGTLMIDHKGKKKRFASTSTPQDKLSFIAFYADCHHEVTAVTAGYRVALTYNLILKGNNKNRKELNEEQEKQKILQDSAALMKLSQAVQSHFNNFDHKNSSSSSPKLIYLLDHEYTKKSLSWSRLKNSDHPRVQALKTTADTLKLDIYLALIDVHQTWECNEGDEWDYESNHYGYKHWYGDNEYEKEEKDLKKIEDYEVDDLIDSGIVCPYCIDSSYNKKDLTEMSLCESDMCWTEAVNKFKPFESEYEGYMGNWGNTLDRWYHRAAIILWRKSDHYVTLHESNPHACIRALLDLFAEINQTDPDAASTEINDAITQVLPHWRGLGQEPSRKDILDCLRLALIIGRSQSAEKLIKYLPQQTLNPQAATLMHQLAESYGIEWLQQSILHWLKPTDYWQKTAEFFIPTLSTIITKLLAEKTKLAQSISIFLLEYQYTYVQKNFADAVKRLSQAVLNDGSKKRIKILSDLIQACLIAQAHTQLKEIITYITSQTSPFVVVDLLPIVQDHHDSFQSSTAGILHSKKLTQHILKNVKIALLCKPRQSDNWSITDCNHCKCKDCKQFALFLHDPNSQELLWPMGKERRRHIHGIIESMKLPMKHVTQHTGSPHKLKLTKTIQLFKRESILREKYEKTLVALRETP